MNIRISTARDLGSGVTTLSLDGELTMITTTAIRSALLKTASECPTAVIVDVSSLVPAQHSLLSVFPTAARLTLLDYGVRMLVCAPSGAIASWLAPFGTLVAVYRDHDAAAAAVQSTKPRWFHASMAPSPIGVSLARNLIRDACLAWDLPQLLLPGRLIISELAQNAAEHTAGPFDVTVACTDRYLRIAVRDTSPTLPWPLGDLSADPQAPLADRGRGLRIVIDTATHWGTTPLVDGKIVWALLRVHPLAAGAVGRPTPPGLELRAPRGDSRPGTGNSWDQSGQGRSTPLSEREMDVLGYLPTMLSTEEIGNELYLSVNTVKAHIKAIYRKLGVSRRRDAVVRAREKGTL